MIVATLLGAAAPAAAVHPSQAFVRGCYERAANQAETNFCVAGEAEAKKLEIQDPEETACFERDQSQQGMNRCAGEAYERADKSLNAQWAKAVADYKGEKGAEKLLLDAQRAWLKYRDAHCQATTYDSLGGSIWLLLNSGCLADLTRKRTQELVQMLEGEAN